MMAAVIRTRARFRALLTAAIASALVFASAPGAAVALPPDADPHFVQVDAGRFGHTAAGVTDDGTVYTWGFGVYGELGEGAGVTDKLTPSPIALPALAAGDRVVQVSVGSTHVLAVTAQGVVLAWGTNDSGQLGLGDTTTRYTPAIVPSTSFPSLSGTIVEVAASGSDHSLARSSTGQVYAWGSNSVGQLGDNTLTTRTSPVRIITSGSAGISAGNSSSYSVSTTGTVAAWGYGADGRLGSGTTSRRVPTGISSFPGLSAGEKIIQVSGGDGHALAVSSLGKVYAWGDDGTGQLGLGAGDDSRSTPGLVAMPVLAAGESVTAVEASEDFSFALTSDGSVLSWGSNGSGQLGLGDTTSRDSAERVASFPAVLDGAPIEAISAGQAGALVVSSTGGVYGTGKFGGTVGDEDAPDWPVSSFTNIRLADLSGTVSLPALSPGTAATANPSGWNAGAVLTYQWQRDLVDIGGATSSSYTPGAGDVGHQLRVVVSATAENYGAGTAASSWDPVLAEAPEIQTLSLPPTNAGDALSIPIVATGSGQLYYIGATLPAGLSIDLLTGVITGTLTVVGDYPVKIEVSSDYGLDTGYFTLSVRPGAVTSLTLTPSDAAPTQGDTIELTVVGFDAYGNSAGNLTASSAFSSDVSTDVIVGNRITFPHASPHTITAVTGGVSQSVVIQVAALDRSLALALTGAASTMTLGYLALTLLGAGLVLVIVRVRVRGGRSTRSSAS